MGNRPLGIDPSFEREFMISPAPVSKHFCKEPETIRERISEWWYYTKNFSFGRGKIIEVELEDHYVKFLFETGWVKERNGEVFFTRKGSQAFCDFANSHLPIKDD